MSDEIVVNFGADVRAVKKGTDEIVEGLDDTAKALDDVGDAGEDAGRKTSDSLDDVGDKAKDTGDAISEVGSVAKSALEGDAAGAAEGLAQSLAGIAGLAGGVGATIGTAVGAGFGFITDQVQAQIEKIAELQTRYSDLYASASDKGRVFLEGAQIQAAAADILFGDTATMDAYRDAAARIGVDINTYVLAQAGSYSDLQVVIEAAAAAEQARIDEIDSARGGEAYDSEVQAISRIRDELAALEQSHADGQAAAEAAAEIKAQLSSDERAAISQNSAADQARWDAYAAAAAAAIASVPAQQTVAVKLDFDEAERAIASFQRKQRYANVEVQLTRNGSPVY